MGRVGCRTANPNRRIGRMSGLSCLDGRQKSLKSVCHVCSMLLVCLLLIVAHLDTPIGESVDQRSCRPQSRMEELAAIAQQVRQQHKSSSSSKCTTLDSSSSSSSSSSTTSP
jgi:hypothetical protein